MAEINEITTGMTDKNRRCYQIMKYFSKILFFLPNYHIKTAVLRHHTTCPDTTDDCVHCVMEIFQDLLEAYEKNKLLSYKSNLNILGTRYIFILEYKCVKIINTLCSVSVTDSWKTFIKKN